MKRDRGGEVERGGKRERESLGKQGEVEKRGENQEREREVEESRAGGSEGRRKKMKCGWSGNKSAASTSLLGNHGGGSIIHIHGDACPTFMYTTCACLYDAIPLSTMYSM